MEGLIFSSQIFGGKNYLFFENRFSCLSSHNMDIINVL